jgi:hypothetical protein
MGCTLAVVQRRAPGLLAEGGLVFLSAMWFGVVVMGMIMAVFVFVFVVMVMVMVMAVRMVCAIGKLHATGSPAFNLHIAFAAAANGTHCCLSLYFRSDGSGRPAIYLCSCAFTGLARLICALHPWGKARRRRQYKQYFAATGFLLATLIPLPAR